MAQLGTVEVEILGYRPQRGDVLVIKCERPLSMESKANLQAMLREMFADHLEVKIMVVDPGVDQQVIRAEGDAE